MTARADIVQSVRAHFHGSVPRKLGIAVSGGGDSVALMHVLKDCFDPAEVTLCAATVDHGLRDSSAAEALQVAGAAAKLGISHDILNWQGWDGQGNLQDQARQARYRLLTDWARSLGIQAVALGHTANDQAETVLMRLSRSAGVTGIAAMPVRRVRNGVTLIRPLLDVSRQRLRDFLTEKNVGWIDDPSNEDTRFGRVRMRKALELLEPLGLTVESLSGVAENMGRADAALDWFTFLAARDLVQLDAGAVILDQHKLRLQPAEIGHRLLRHALMWVGGSGYPPRRAPMTDLLEAVREGRGATLAGCRILCSGGKIWVARELNAVKDLACAPGALWDRHWRLQGGVTAGQQTRVLGSAGLKLCDNWRATGLPRPVLEAAPALWRGCDLEAAPLAGMGNGWHISEARSSEEFFASLLSH